MQMGPLVKNSCILVIGWTIFFTLSGLNMAKAAIPEVQGDKHMWEAVRKGDLVAIEQLLGQGADINSRNEQDLTPLMIACAEGNSVLTTFLLQKGADVNARHQYGVTALCLAALGEKYPIVEKLLDHGAKVELADANGRTPLLLAAMGRTQNAVDIVNLLLARGADIHHQDDEGNTALMLAVFGPPSPPQPQIKAGVQPETKAINPQVQLTSSLIKRGADLKAINKAGETAVSLAKASQNDKLVALLLDEEIKKRE
jgi:ankyrin repeat protein